MKELWRCSTALVLLQAAAFAAEYMVSGGDAGKSYAAAASAAGAVAVVAGWYVWRCEELLPELGMSPTIFLCALAAMFITIPSDSTLAPVVYTTLAGFCTLGAAAFQRRPGESFLLRTFAASPYGIGMIFGGGILLYQHRLAARAEFACHVAVYVSFGIAGLCGFAAAFQPSPFSWYGGLLAFGFACWGAYERFSLAKEK